MSYHLEDVLGRSATALLLVDGVKFHDALASSTPPLVQLERNVLPSLDLGQQPIESLVHQLQLFVAGLLGTFELVLFEVGPVLALTLPAFTAMLVMEESGYFCTSDEWLQKLSGHLVD